MRKVSQEAADAFMSGRKYKSGNTEVEPMYIAKHGTVTFRLVLHGNVIARRVSDESEFEITFAGYQTNTTKERLNALPGVSIYFAGGKRGYHDGDTETGQGTANNNA